MAPKDGRATGNAPLIRQGRRSLLHLWLLLLSLLLAFPLLLLERRSAQQSTQNSRLLQPQFSPPEGLYENDLLVDIQNPIPDTELWFTLDGNVPDANHGSLYRQPISIQADAPSATIIRARVRFPDGEYGPVASATYLGIRSEMDVLSLIVDPDDLWNAESGLLIYPDGRGQAWERTVEVSYLDHTDQIQFHVPAGLRIHGNSTRRIEKKSFRLYFREEYGLNRLDYPLFASSGRAASVPFDASRPSSFKRLVIHDGGQDFAYPRYGANWTLIRTHLVNELADETQTLTTYCQPVLLLINGKPQGIYLIRNYIDDWFFRDEYDVEITPFEAAKIRWLDLLDYLDTHDLSIPENYAYVESQINVGNLIDYYIMQMYATDTDWLYTNVERFLPQTQGGQWNWILWDVDYSFGLAPWNDFDSDMVDYVLHADRPGIEKEALLFRRLIANPIFRDTFLARTAGLLNTTLSHRNVEEKIDALADELRSDIPIEEALWSSPGNWESSIQYLHEFARQRPDYFRMHLVQHFNLDGISTVKVSPATEGKGRVAINGTLLPEETWQGFYFAGLEIDVTALPESGYQFSEWSIEGGIDDAALVPQNAQLSLRVTDPITLTAQFVPISPGVPQIGDVIITQVQADDDRLGGDWIELKVARPGDLDLRGWRLTDNDSKTRTDEGSLIFSNAPELGRVPYGTLITIIATESIENDLLYPQDQLSAGNGRMLLYAGNNHLLTNLDPWFNLTTGDNLALLAPGDSSSQDDDLTVAFSTIGDYNHSAVTPHAFGILADGIPIINP